MNNYQRKTLIKNRTIQNKSKARRLNSEHSIPAQSVKKAEIISFLKSLQEYSESKETILYSIGSYLLRRNNNPITKAFLKEYKYKIITIKNIPENEFDILGSAYQFLNTKKENLEKGTFYTGSEIARDFVHDLDFSDGQVIFDPACGSGAFLFNSQAPAEQIFGVDFDPVAIMIAKFNYFIKFPDASYPKLYCEDFFSWYSDNREERFDYIIGNPPYGASLDMSRIQPRFISSVESFSYFTEFCFQLLKKGGVLRFLLPEAALNVRKHRDLRNFILDQTNLKRIKRYSSKFSGVMSDVYMIELNRERNLDVLFVDKVTTAIPKDIYKDFQNQIFVCLTKQDIAIVEKVNNLKKFDLSKSVFGLGVVTGDNKSKMHTERIQGSEHIYTGKEVEKYRLTSPRNYLVFDRSKLQQVAPDEIYRAGEKLVYKTINKFLKVAVDTTGSLTSNSANIIIPLGADLNIYTIMAFLNSNLYSYIHLKLFGGVNKIAKENLMALPLPGISPRQDRMIKSLMEGVLQGGSDADLQNYIHQNIFDLTDSEVEYINKVTFARPVVEKRKTAIPYVPDRFSPERTDQVHTLQLI